MTDATSGFRNVIQASGLEPPGDIQPGKLHRFPGIGKRKSNRAGWCLLFEDEQGGLFGDWSSGLSETWWANRFEPLLDADRRAFARRIEAARQQANAERQKRRAAAMARAAEIWGSSAPADNDHPYLRHKQIQTHGARSHNGALVVPIVDFAGALNSLQFIGQDGRKRLLAGGRKHGCFIPVSVDTANVSHQVIICEGWATGCTLAEMEPQAMVLAAIDAGNLQPVAVAAAGTWPNAEILIAGDDDRLTESNPGATQARLAAAASGALYVLPPWPTEAPSHLTDFNDLAVWLNGGAV